jgi:PKD repeat protein
VDPRTNGQLKTVPDGELASVRLGNWQVGAQAERIEYNFYVDTLSSAILELNYAVVLEDPNHDSLSQPRFTMEILTQKELPIDEFGCGEAFFSAGFNTNKEEGWHKMDNGWWKEWTKVSINLSKFHGQSLKIRLTTYDCTQTGHYGYAYFTLGCSDGKLKGLTCGDADSTLFKAPDGFKYRWYLPDDPTNVISTAQTFSRPANDTLTYFVDVIQPTNTDCFYTLEASMVGRWPRAKASYNHEVKSCSNVVSFYNQSYIKRINQITKDSISTSGKCEDFVWDFGDGNFSTEENPIHVYADEGGVYMVRLMAGIADGKCMDDTTFTIVLPKVGESVDTTYAVICDGESYLFNGDPKKTISESGIYSDTVINEFGCYLISVLDLTVLQKPQDTYIYDTICSHEKYYFDGELITETGVYKKSFKTENGCDSVSVLNLLVNESLFIDFDSTVWVCEDDENLIIPYNLLSGNFLLCDVDMKMTSNNTSYVKVSDVVPNPDALVVPIPDNIVPGKYDLNLSFGRTACGLESVVVPIQVYYSKQIMAQRWNDVLAVKNEKYNHLWNDNDTSGYQFIAFQWYKNGQPIIGATSSILYEPDGLDLDAEYSVLLTRLPDNVTIMSCVADLQDLSIKNDDVVVFETNKTLSVIASCSAQMRIWTSTGILIKSIDVFKGENVIYTTELSSGVYILDFLFENGERDVKQIVLE